MAVTSVQPGEKVKEKSALENAAMLLGIGAQLGQLAFSASDAFNRAPANAATQAPVPPQQPPVAPEDQRKPLQTWRI